jgi:hypothetical protein
LVIEKHITVKVRLASSSEAFIISCFPRSGAEGTSANGPLRNGCQAENGLQNCAVKKNTILIARDDLHVVSDLLGLTASLAECGRIFSDFHPCTVDVPFVGPVVWGSNGTLAGMHLASAGVAG